MLLLHVTIILLLLYLLYTAVTTEFYNGFRRTMPCCSWSFTQFSSCLLPCLRSHTVPLKIHSRGPGMRATTRHAYAVPPAKPQ